MSLEKIKSIFLKALIACLVAAAVLAVVTVLVGHFNDILEKALFTIVLIGVHSLVSFGFIVNNEQQETFDNLSFFTNVTFGIIILSFITSIFGVWHVFPGDLVAKLYEVYFVLLFASLHGEILAKTLGKQANINNIVYANYIFMLLVIVMLMPVIFTNGGSSLGSFYYRLLAAFGIIDATLTLIAVILHKLYLQKHPKINDNVFSMQLQNVPGQVNPQYVQVPVQQKRRGMNIFVVILIGYIFLQFLGGIFVVILGRVNR